MEFLYTPAACSISPHIVLEEIGVPYQARPVAIMEGETRSEAFLTINPKGKIPVLILDDGTVVTENPIILLLLARTFPDRALLPTDRTLEFEALQICEYLTGTVHPFGISRLFRPSMFCGDEGRADEVRAAGAEVMRRGFELLAPKLENRSYLLGDFSIADASLFYFELHAGRLGLSLPAPVRSHFQRMLQRPAVQRVLERERIDRAAYGLN